MGSFTCNVYIELQALEAQAISIWVFEKERELTSGSISINTNQMMRDIYKKR